MRRFSLNNVNKMLIDAALASIALFLAYQLRYDGSVPAFYSAQQFALLLPVALLRIVAGLSFGLARQRWRYFSMADVGRIVCAHSAVMLVLLILRGTAPRGGFLFIPLGVIALQFLTSLAGSTGCRILWQIVCERAEKSRAAAGYGQKNALVLGAGFHGVTVAQAMARTQGVRVVGFLDDDREKIGRVIAGIPVIGPVDSLPEVLKSCRVDDVLVCLPPSARFDRILSQAEGKGNIRVRLVPTVQELMRQENHTLPGNGRPKRLVVSMPRSTVSAPFGNKRILITGGAGFIGSSLAERLVENNRLVLFDQAFINKPVEFTSLIGHPNVEVVQGDILNEQDLAKVCKGVDMVVHTAAVLGVGKVCGASRETLETNYIGTSRLLKALERNGRLERFVYFSTSEVFGVNSFQVDEATPPTVGPIAESRWSYAIAKLAGEHLAKSYHREAKMPVTIVRPFNIFGPRRNGDYALRGFILSALANRPLEVHGDGTQIRAWCFIDDFNDALVAMLARPAAVGEDFNIGNPANTLTILELARKVIDISGSESKIQLVEHPFPDINIRVPSLTKAETLLGYAPRFSLDSGLAITIEWHRENLPNSAVPVAPALDKAHVAVAAAQG